MKTRLGEVLTQQASYTDSSQMIEFIGKKLTANPDVHWYMDEHRNIFAEKHTIPEHETVPAFACHTDTVHKIHPGFKVDKVQTPGGNVWYAYHDVNGKQESLGVGGDDKCGVFICLRMLEVLSNVKCAFFADEESGCKGSNKADLAFFDNCRWVIQPDRRNGFDLIFTGAGTSLCSEDFKSKILKISKELGYESAAGSVTDVVALKQRGLGISVMNISCGYHEPHSKREYIIEKQLMRTYSICLSAAFLIVDVMPHTKPAPIKNTSSRHCSLCQRYLLQSEVGICDPCFNKPPFKGNQKKCSICRTFITTKELDLGVCYSCIDLNIDACQVCAIPLESNAEKDEGMCDPCIRDLYHTR